MKTKRYHCIDCDDEEYFETKAEAAAAGLAYRAEYEGVMCDACYQFAQEAAEDWQANRADALGL